MKKQEELASNDVTRSLQTLPVTYQREGRHADLSLSHAQEYK